MPGRVERSLDEVGDGELYRDSSLFRVVPALSQQCSGRAVSQSGQAYEVVSGYRQFRPHLVSIHSPVPQIATASHCLHPTEHLLDPFAYTLRQPVRTAPGDPSIYR